MRYFFPLIALFALLSVTSCDEKEEVGEYDDWQNRNTEFVDSIATLANAGTDGWSKLQSITLSDNLGTDADNKYYIYVQKLENGAGTYNPHDADSVRVHYCGRLIPTSTYPAGEVFDKSYSGAVLNEATDVPALLRTIGTVPGFATALENMVEGDRWKVVIPSYLGYGSSGNSSIPAYSTLVFDMKLARIYPFGSGENTSWH